MKRRILTIIGILMCLACPLSFMVGCEGPTSKIDTDGDGRPDTEMTADRAVAWGKAQEAKKIAEVEAEKAAAVAKVKKAQRDAERTIANITAGNQGEIRKVQDRLSDDIEGAAADLDRLVAAKKLEVESVGSTVNAALAEIDRKAALVSSILPIAQGAAGMIPGAGGIVASVLGIVGAGWIGRASGQKAGEQKGLAVGKSLGVAEGKDAGWDDREKHQAQIDATWDAAHREAMLLTGAIRPGVSST